MQTYDPLKPISGTTKLSQLYQIIRDHIASLVSNFQGTAFPTSPTVGQHCFRSDVNLEYVYTAASGWSEVANAGTGLGLEIINARGSLASLDQRFDVSQNEDGTLKAATTLNPSQWYSMTKASGVISTTQFRLYGADGTAIYYPTRRLKINRSSGGTAFTEVVSSSYGAPDTTVVVRDAVISSLVSVEHSIIGPRKAAAGDGAVSYEMIANKQVALPTTTYTVLIGDSIILASGTFTITGIAASLFGAGRILAIINISTGAITYDPAGTETVDGSSSSLTIPQGNSLLMVCDGVNWKRLDQPAILSGPILTNPTINSGALQGTTTIVVSAYTTGPTLGTNWSATSTVGYMKDPMGFVHLKGVVSSGGSGAATIFTLPSGYRPDQNLIVRTGHISSSGMPATLNINSDGTIVSNSGCRASGDVYYFDSITFKVA